MIDPAVSGSGIAVTNGRDAMRQAEYRPVYPATVHYRTSSQVEWEREIYSVTDLQRAFADEGSHFFDRDTMRFFRSRVADDLVPLSDGTIGFITSEQFEDMRGYRAARLYTVRVVVERDGSLDVEEPHGFQAFATLRQARAALRRYANGLVPRHGD